MTERSFWGERHLYIYTHYSRMILSQFIVISIVVDSHIFMHTFTQFCALMVRSLKPIQVCHPCKSLRVI